MRGLVGLVVLLLALVGCSHEPPEYVSTYTPPVSTTVAPEPLMASFVETFDRPDSPAGLGEGWEMLQRLYAPKLPADDGMLRDGKYTYRGDNIVYAVRQFREPVRRVGATGQWRQDRDGTDTAIALVISGNPNLITDMLHLVVERERWALTVRRNNGDFEPVINGTFSPPLEVARDYQFELEATDDTATVRLAGVERTGNVSTAGLLGNFAFWEEFPMPKGTRAGTVFDFDTVWAAEDGQPLQPVT